MKITIEKQDLTVETLTIPDDQIDAVMAELTERFGKRDGFVVGQQVSCATGQTGGSADQDVDGIAMVMQKAIGSLRVEIAMIQANLDKRNVILESYVEGGMRVTTRGFSAIFNATDIDGMVRFIDGGDNPCDERRLAEQRLRKAYLAVTGGAKVEEREFYVPYLHNNKTWDGVCHIIAAEPHPYRFATAEQAAAFGRDNGEDLIRMMSV